MLHRTRAPAPTPRPRFVIYLPRARVPRLLHSPRSAPGDMRAWPALCLLLAARRVASLHNGVPLVPAMGWSSWNTFRCDISSKLVLEVADELVGSGLRDSGYVYVSIDDCWMLHERDAAGHLAVDEAKFPVRSPLQPSHLSLAASLLPMACRAETSTHQEGMKWLGDELHNVSAARMSARCALSLTRRCLSSAACSLASTQPRATRRARDTPLPGGTSQWTPPISRRGASTT